MRIEFWNPADIQYIYYPIVRMRLIDKKWWKEGNHAPFIAVKVTRARADGTERAYDELYLFNSVTKMDNIHHCVFKEDDV